MRKLNSQLKHERIDKLIYFIIFLFLGDVSSIIGCYKNWVPENSVMGTFFQWEEDEIPRLACFNKIFFIFKYDNTSRKVCVCVCSLMIMSYQYFI